MYPTEAGTLCQRAISSREIREVKEGSGEGKAVADQLLLHAGGGV